MAGGGDDDDGLAAAQAPAPGTAVGLSGKATITLSAGSDLTVRLPDAP